MRKLRALEVGYSFTRYEFGSRAKAVREDKIMETIEVRYMYIEYGYYHNYIFYTDSKGNQFGARGGPSSDVGINCKAKGATTAESGLSCVSGDSPFGPN